MAADGGWGEILAVTEAQIVRCEEAAEQASGMAETLTERRDLVEFVTASSDASSEFRAELALSVEAFTDLALAFADAADAMRRYLAPPAAIGSTRAASGAGRKAYTAGDVQVVERHLARLDHSPANDAMISRIRSALAAGLPLAEGDRHFMTHELTESRLMDEGMSYEDAHERALGTHPLMRNYAPEVIDQFPMLFNNNWRRAWGMEPR
jgi:hypothetical protein